jgi:hypothetical protein
VYQTFQFENIVTKRFYNYYLNINSDPESLENAKIGIAVRDTLECHICRDKLISPVHTCVECHYICGYCYPNLTGNRARKCYCSKAIIRFPGLDSTLKLVHNQVDCKYLEDGCKFKDNATTILDHVKVCKFR